MAIGDNFSLILGTAATDRQPSAGVEEQLSSIHTGAQTDEAQYYDGTNSLNILEGNVITGRRSSEAPSYMNGAANLGININNSVYFRKNGTTDRIAITGIQTAT